MRASTAALTFALGLALAQLASCGGGDSESSNGSASHSLLVSSLSVPLLQSIEPAQAFHSDRIELKLTLAGISVPVTAAWIGNVRAAEIRQADLGTAVAVFEAGTEEQVGLHDVTVGFADGTSTSLPRAFRRQLRQDPVVFVHGCPLPRQSVGDRSIALGSVTNYYTSKFWHPLYRKLQKAGYPAPRWQDEDDFLDSPRFDHASTHPGDRNYLNVFAMSEDSRDRNHEEKEPPDELLYAGHCGSGLRMAEELASYIDQVLAATGAAKVDLIVNSAGALGARWYLLKHRGTEKVRDVVFLAGMNHGTEVAIVPTVHNREATWWKPNYEAAREGFPAYACAGQGGGSTARNEVLSQDLQFRVNGCVLPGTGPARDALQEIPADHRKSDKLAGGVAYLNIYNVGLDELIEPTTSACLAQRFQGDCTDTDLNVAVQARSPVDPSDTPHSAIRSDPEVVDLTACHVMRRGPAQAQPSHNCKAERLAAQAP